VQLSLCVLAIPFQHADDAEAVDWLHAVSRRDSAALEALYGRYSGPVFSLLCHMLEREAAEEVLQDAFVRVWNHAHRYDESRSTPLSWILTIARNLARDRLRKKRHEPTAVSLSPDSTEQTRGGADEKSLEWNDIPYYKKEILQGPLGRLPARQREVIELAFLQGYAHGEIAELTGRPLGTVKSDIRRGLISLRDWVEENES